MSAVCARSVAGPAAIFSLALLVAMAGCSDGLNLVGVSGTVTFDGRPLEGATVVFRPKQGRPSAGTTDAQGRYVLRYTAEKRGSLAGEHTVSITTAVNASDDTASTSKEIVPARYNQKSTLKAMVDFSHRTHDFALESK